METVGIRELSRETAGVIELLKTSDGPIVITKQGRPVATLAPVDETEAQNLALSLASEIHETSSLTEANISPRKTRSIDEVSEELAAEAMQTPEGREALAELSANFSQQRIQVSKDVARVFADAQKHAQRVMDEAMRSAQESVQSLQKSIASSEQMAKAKTTGQEALSKSKRRLTRQAKRGKATAKSR